MRRLLGLALALAGAPASAGCLPAGTGAPMQGPPAAPFAATIALQPQPPRVGQPFSVALTVCGETARPFERLAIDAWMPVHRHGMNFRPELVALGDGRFEARGFLFHMAGRWEITLSVYAAGEPTHLTHRVVLE